MIGLQDRAREASLGCSPTEIINGDLLKCGWQYDADIVYLSCLCFGEEMMSAI